MSQLSTLDQLVDALVRLVALLALDPACQWTRHFASELERARQLREGMISSRELAELSASIRHVFGGMGSFNDYAPAVYDSATRRYVVVPGTEDFDSVRCEVFDLALALIASTP